MKTLLQLTQLLLLLFIGFVVGVYFSNSEAFSKLLSSFKADNPQTQIISDRFTLPSIIDAAQPEADESAPEDPMLLLFKQLLEAERYDEAIALFNTIGDAARSSQDKLIAISPLKASFVEHIQELLAEAQLNQSRIKHALDTYLQYFYNDLDVLLLSAKFQMQLNHFYEGFQAFQLASSFAYSTKDKELVSAHYDHYMQTIFQRLSKTQQWELLLDIYSFAENSNLLTYEDRFNRMQVFLQNGQTEQALAEADYLQNNAASADDQNKVSALLKQFNAEPQQSPIIETPKANPDAGVAMTKYYHQFLVPVSFHNNSVDNDATLLLDTGASLTTLSRDYFNSISGSASMQYKGTRDFNTANGRASGEVYTSRQFKLGNYVLENIDIAVLDYSSSGQSVGLLGMNVLRNFQFSIDQDEAFLNLKQK